MPNPSRLASIASQFAIDGGLDSVEPFGSGHINDTYACLYKGTSGRTRYVLQRINGTVFKRPDQVMENIGRVTEHLRRTIEASGGDPGRETLTFLQAADGRLYHVDGEGGHWRMCRLLEGLRSFDIPESPGQVRAAARAFGRFQAMLADLPGERLHDTIPDFHNTKRRYESFVKAVDRDKVNRARGAVTEIDFARSRENLASGLVDLQAQGLVPERIAHNDTKLNNVLFDQRTGEAVCVIDLDTVMPGLALHDFGDMVRVAASTAAEDERDVAKVGIDMAAFGQLAAGYIEALGGVLSPVEVANLPVAALVITFEQGLRFLADYIEGDVYYKTHVADHNLCRCRTQFALVAAMERSRRAMDAAVDSCR